MDIEMETQYEEHGTNILRDKEHDLVKTEDFSSCSMFSTETATKPPPKTPPRNPPPETPLRHIPISFMGCITLIVLSIKYIQTKFHYMLLVSSGAFLKFKAEKLTAQFDLKLENLYDTVVLLTFGEAFGLFIPEITDKMTIMVGFLLILLLIWPLQPVYQMSIMLILISESLHYIFKLFGKLSGVGVTCGVFKLPLLWFTTTAAFALSLIVCFMMLLMIYLIQRYVGAGRSKVREPDFTFEDFSVIVQGMGGEVESYK
ncbi:uncharacterized protein LOC124823077 [Vigna umbellata]|uniref:uncharacterized protein LOC124823077 n=1 Tax=Vigna umbellata TaxID=87088 RepID=UPI001F5E6C4A|nr:uncharacterized protein LOC124823077 [Vigna umbellata]